MRGQDISNPKCGACKDGVDSPFSFSMAFQPIVDTVDQTVYAYEALVRGPQAQPAAWVLGQVNESNRYSFDQSCRVRAIELAAKLRLPQTGAKLSINFMPGAVYSPAACIRLTLERARLTGFPLHQLIFEITETEQVQDEAHLLGIVEEYRKHGFLMALDDFGAGYSTLNLLAGFVPEVLKLDMALIRDIGSRPAALSIVRAVTALAQSLGSLIVAEGVETVEEFQILQGCGIRLMQGYLFARPAFEALPKITFPGSHVVPASQYPPARRNKLPSPVPAQQLVPLTSIGGVAR